MIDRADLQFVIWDNDMSAMSPVFDPISASVTRGRQPTGLMTLALRRNDPALAESGILIPPAGPGALYLLACYFRDFSAPFQIVRCQVAEMGDYFLLSGEALFSEILRSRLVMASGTTVSDSYTGKADNVARAYLRANFVTPTAIIPTNYPRATRDEFGGIVVAVEADTTAHPTTITYDVSVGQNAVEWAEEFALKWNLRWTLSLAAATATFGLVYPYQKADKSITGGFLLTPSLGTLESWKEIMDYTAIRNTWLLVDGTNRTWRTDNTSVAAYGNKEAEIKMEVGGAVPSVAMRGYESDDLLAKGKDPDQRIEIAPRDASWFEFITHYGVGDLVTAADYYGWDREVDLQIVDATIDLPQGGGGATVKLGIGIGPRDRFGEGWRLLGPKGGREMGSRFALGTGG